jgi:hypothetical protein
VADSQHGTQNDEVRKANERLSIVITTGEDTQAVTVANRRLRYFDTVLRSSDYMSEIEVK